MLTQILLSSQIVPKVHSQALRPEPQFWYPHIIFEPDAQKLREPLGREVFEVRLCRA